jgi:uncharacterized GH25 family protein
LIFASIVSLGALVDAQDNRQIPIGTSSISGTVVAADTGFAVAGVRVHIEGQTKCSAVAPAAQSESLELERMTTTDASGQFSFPRLPAGVFKISLSSPQDKFLETEYGQRRRGGSGQSIPLADGQQLALKIPMHRGAVIAGIVRGPDGEPLRNATVRALRYERENGFRRLESVADTQTDDRGAYRVFGLEAGDYLISAQPNISEPSYQKRMEADANLVERAIAAATVTGPPRSASVPAISVSIPAPRESGFEFAESVYLPTYAPSSPTVPAATTITVTGSEERSAVDIRAHFIRSSTIDGVVTTPLDADVSADLWLVPEDLSAPLWEGNRMVRPDRDGRFKFGFVAPGNYTIFAQTVVAQPAARIVDGEYVQPKAPALTDAQKMWGKAHVTVARESETSVSLSLEPARSISGVVVTQQQSFLTRPSLAIIAQPAQSSDQIQLPMELRASLQPDGRFTISGVPAGRYILKLNGGNLKSAIVSGQEVLDLPFEFTAERDVTGAVLTTAERSSELTGALTDSTGKPALDYTVVVAATDSRYWDPQSHRIAMTETDYEGRFQISSLPAGSYFIAVLIDPEPGAVYDPEFLRTIARTSVPVTIPEGGRVTQNLRVK